jgi:hypothetical protein
MKFEQHKESQIGVCYSFDPPVAEEDEFYFLAETRDADEVGKTLEELAETFGAYDEENVSERWMFTLNRVTNGVNDDLTYQNGEFYLIHSAVGDVKYVLEVTFQDVADAVMFKLKYNVKS